MADAEYAAERVLRQAVERALHHRAGLGRAGRGQRHPEDLEAIAEAYARMEAAKDPESFLEPDLDFHSRIAEATHNELLAHLCNMFSLALRESMTHSNRRPNLHELALPRHKAILTAIQNRDTLGARHASLVQLEDARAALSAVLGRISHFKSELRAPCGGLRF
ncbi:FadR/GntR family transcriptional regulator [Azotobacter sp. CWF10]